MKTSTKRIGQLKNATESTIELEKEFIIEEISSSKVKTGGSPSDRCACPSCNQRCGVPCGQQCYQQCSTGNCGH